MQIIEIISSWDPQNLMSHAPDDEYSYEANKIEKALLDIKDKIELAKVIYMVFSEQFGKDFIKTYDECIEVADQILKSRQY